MLGDKKTARMTKSYLLRYITHPEKNGCHQKNKAFLASNGINLDRASKNNEKL
jgi:hypothetical protein